MILKGYPYFARGVLLAAGYRWELRHYGDLKIGLWRRSWTKKSQKKKPFPKRFVFLPGFGDSPFSWISVFALLTPVFSRKFDEVVLVSYPGFSGFLHKERFFHSMDLLIQSIHGTLSSLRPHTLMGHSLGGWLSAHYASSPQRGSGYKGPEVLILANPSGVFENEEARAEWKKKFQAVMEGHGFNALRPHLFAREPRWFKFIADEFAKHFLKEEVTQFMLSVRDDHFVQEHLNKIHSRVWLLWGEKDTLHPVSWAMTWIKGLTGDQGLAKHAKAVVIKGVGHSPQVENPAATAAVLAQIFREKELPRFGRRFWQVLEQAG